MASQKNLIVVGDRILVDPDIPKERTTHGLYLPQGVEEKEKIQTGTVVKVGPGYPLPELNSPGDEPWMNSQRTEPKYIPVQAQEGDYAIFLRKAAIDIEFEGRAYLIVPQNAILVLIRDGEN